MILSGRTVVPSLYILNMPSREPGNQPAVHIPINSLLSLGLSSDGRRSAAGVLGAHLADWRVRRHRCSHPSRHSSAWRPAGLPRASDTWYEEYLCELREAGAAGAPRFRPPVLLPSALLFHNQSVVPSIISSPGYSRRMVRSEESGDQTGAVAGAREDNERRQAKTSLLYSLERSRWPGRAWQCSQYCAGTRWRLPASRLGVEGWRLDLGGGAAGSRSVRRAAPWTCQRGRRGDGRLERRPSATRQHR
jgi:hypothetical protein